MNKKAHIRCYVTQEVASDFERIANAERMESADAAKMVFSRLSTLKDGALLDALASIPKEFFKGRPGRPPTSSRPTGQGSATADDMSQETTRVPVLQERSPVTRS